jgi:hypothetical protein
VPTPHMACKILLPKAIIKTRGTGELPVCNISVSVVWEIG